VALPAGGDKHAVGGVADCPDKRVAVGSRRAETGPRAFDGWAVRANRTVLADCVKSLAERRRDRLDEPVVARPVVVVRVGRNRLRAVAGEQTGRMRSDIHARGRVVHHRAVVARRSAATESGSQRLHAVGNHGNLDPRAAEETGGVRAGGDDEGVERAGLYAPIRAFIVHRFAVYRSATPTRSSGPSPASETGVWVSTATPSRRARSPMAAT